MKKVLLISHFSNLSGAPISLALMSKHLKKYGYSPTLCLPTHGQLESFLKQNGIDYVITGVIGSLFNLYKLIKRENISIVHANTIISAPQAILAKFMGCKLIWHIREDIKPKSLIAKIVGKFSDKIIVLADYMKSVYGDKYQAKVRVVANGIDPSLFDDLSEKKLSDLKKELGISDKKIILLAGTIEARKGQKELIAATKYLKYKSYEVIIVGDPLPGQAVFKEKLKKIVDENNLPVRFFEARPDIPALMQLTDIVCVPSLAEPFGRVVIEGMAAGKPVVGSNVGGIKDIIIDGCTGCLFSAGDSKMLAEKLDLLLNDKQKCIKMGQDGKSRVLDFYTIDVHVENIKNIYEELAGE